MHNKDIAKILKLAGSLMELHGEDTFKTKAYLAASFYLDKLHIPLHELSESEMAEKGGVSKSMASKISAIVRTHTFPELQNLLNHTPQGVLRMLEIRGLGPKKVRAIWKDLRIESSEELLKACYQGTLSELKGFGKAIQQDIIDYLEFKKECAGKWHYAEAEAATKALQQKFSEIFPDDLFVLAGEMARKMEVVSEILVLARTGDPIGMGKKLTELDFLQFDITHSSPFIWRGVLSGINIPVCIKFVTKQDFYSQLYLNQSSIRHLETEIQPQITLFKFLRSHVFASEEEIFESLGWPYLPAETREGMAEIAWITKKTPPPLVTISDIKGALHNHTTYSDGENTCEEMALACIQAGYQYVGISDHSQSATYANGLSEDKILQQHEEIDQLNKKFSPFKIFKGIESDILADGSLDYPERILQLFDFVVASVHSNLNMDEQKATYRLLKAIENPYTTILGHPTGRLLLHRKGYPIDHKKIIDACAAHRVIIEINADPWRLDIDWRWIPYALEKGVVLSINPDAHHIGGLQNMCFGVNIARKACVSPAHLLNTKTAAELQEYFEKRIRNLR